MRSVHTAAPGDIPIKPRIGNVFTTIRTFTIPKISGAVSTIEVQTVYITATHQKCGFRYTIDSGRTTTRKIESTIKATILIWMSFRSRIDFAEWHSSGPC